MSNLLRFLKMLDYGLASLSIEPRPRRRYELPTYEIPTRELSTFKRREPRHFMTAEERWYALGERLRVAAQKVVGANA